MSELQYEESYRERIFKMDSVASYLTEYGRSENELLSGQRLNGAGAFDGEREFIELAEAAYETDQHSVFRIRPNECALLVIDMQEDLVDPEGPMCVPEAYRQVPRIKRVVEHCRSLRIPVFYTEVTIPRDAPHDYPEFFPPIRMGAVTEGTPGARVYHELHPQADDRVLTTKFGFDSFNGTPLDYLMRQQGVRTVLICGTLTNFCCETTARSAYGLGYHVVFGSDINATDNAEAQRATLRTMRRGFARVMDHHAIIRALDGQDDAYAGAGVDQAAAPD